MPALRHLEGAFLNYVQEVLSSSKARQRGLYNREFVDTMLQEPAAHMSPKGHSRLGQAALLEGWLQTILENRVVYLFRSKDGVGQQAGSDKGLNNHVIELQGEINRLLAPMVERFTATSRESVEWSVTFSDPNTWTRPWTFSMQLTRVGADQQIYEYACHEGNLAMRNILSAQRAADAKR